MKVNIPYMDPMGIEPYDPYELDTLKAAKMPETQRATKTACLFIAAQVASSADRARNDVFRYTIPETNIAPKNGGFQ